MTIPLSGLALGRFEFRPGDVGMGFVVDGRIWRLADVGIQVETQAQLFESWDEILDELEEVAAQIHNGTSIFGIGAEAQQLKVLTPIQPQNLFQSGANYRTHVIELRIAKGLELDPGADVETLRTQAGKMMDDRAKNDQPYAFLGVPSSITGPYDDVILPPYGQQHDWELELAVVIGKPSYRVAVEDAMSCVAGYTICNDVTTRDLVFRPDLPTIGTDWLASKNAPTFFPTGPYLVPARYVKDPNSLRVTLSLNGRVMQDASTADMIFTIPRMIAHISATVPMLPGDALLMGSPSGNGVHYGRFLQPGDVMDASITGLGTQRNRCVAFGADADE